MTSIARRNQARRRAAARLCPKCQRKGALKVVLQPGQTVVYCRWDDCDYENGTMTVR